MKYCPLCTKPLILKEIDSINRLSCSNKCCDFVFWDNPTPIIGCIVEIVEGVLLCHNRLWPPDIYSIISSFLEKGESPENAAIREIAEELGLKGLSTTLVGIYPFIECNQIVIVYHVKSEGKILLSNEIDSVRLYTREELKEWPFGQEKLKGWPFGAGWAIRDWLEKEKE